MRRPAALLCAAALAAGCGGAVDVQAPAARPASTAPAPAGGPAEPPPVVRDATAVQDLLDEAAAAFRDADRQALSSLLHDPGSAFGQAWLDRADHMAGLPLSTYALRLDDEVPDLATDRVRRSFDGDVQVVYVVEELAFEGFDDEPAEEEIFATVVDDGDGWRLASDRDGEGLGFVSVDHLWDHGEVTATRDGPVLAIHHPDGPPIGALLAETRVALAAAEDRWPLDWGGSAVVIVPRDEEELAALLHVTFDLSNFVAFATATRTGELGDYELTGSRILVNPVRFLDRSSAERREILSHELLHVATRPAAGPMIPSWVDEGVAQVFGDQRSSTGTALLDAVPTGDLAPPTDGQFTVGGRDRIYLSYQVAWSLVDHLVERFGADAVGAFYRALGRGSIGEPGTESHHVDRAAREVFGEGVDDLVTAWRASR